MSTTTSDFNLQKISTKELVDNLQATINYGGAIFIAGRRGSGKTQISQEAIRTLNFSGLYLNLSTLERADFSGYPDFFGAKNGERYVKFLLPNFYSSLIEGDQKVVVLLDEIDKADPSLLAPLLEFTQFKSINGQPLKNLQAVIMTGNLQAEGGQRPSLPLLDRAEKFLVEVNPDHWLDWGATTGEIHPSVSAYISDNRQDLIGDVDPQEDYADPSPRGWHNASKLLFFGEKHKWHPKMMLHKVSACVGKKIGIRYSSFFEHYQELLPMVDSIIKGEKNIKEFNSLENTKKLVVCMVLCARYAKMLDNYKASLDDKQLDNIKLPEKLRDAGFHISNFMLDVDPEITLISIRGQLGAQRLLEFNLIDDKNWDRTLSELLSKLKN